MKGIFSDNLVRDLLIIEYEENKRKEKEEEEKDERNK